MDPLADDYPYNSPYAFSENKVVNGVELEGLEYVRRIHNEDAQGKVSTRDVVYYKMSKKQVRAAGGTPAGGYNAAAYGPEGKGIQHLYYKNGNLVGKRWDLPRNSFSGKVGSHGIYSGPGSITHGGNGTDYDFSWQPIDIADAIAKNHDINYSTSASENYQGFVEDVRTLGADLTMLQQIDAVLGGATAGDLGLEAPFRSGMSGETRVALKSQKFFIGALANYKTWKNGQANNGDGISITNDDHAQAYIDAGSSRTERLYREYVIVPLLRKSTGN